ncbi:molybdate ABC transporter substrate-binding protein [Roseovarius sp. SCSIO 43702]|uniref:molybdate ABC transporter substrate-binding protein n=1 Tax=Roseovarius sp. SCSIO 43702 TaxID=2823043 RepID=UPI001C72F08C|nr:molybdate ABC transporter substrate-binding protein [Roseovarius sp. SCSIO 43702]QYX56073.1 molybdate ABC transporter substrate-binding protein [Roseovarius sp. SCSIO 43702]
MIRFFAFLTSICLVSVQAAGAEPLRVFAAASLSGALEEMRVAWPGDAVISYGGSGSIARQVAQGAPADVVILANTAWIDWLEAEGALREGATLTLLGNRLVLIAPEGAADLPELTPEALLDRLGDGRMAVGQVLSVPAGIYAKEWMDAAGLWRALSPHLAETSDVRAALALVERGEAPLGVVYASDAKGARVRVLHEIDESLHSPIRYGAAITRASNHPQASEFVDYMLGEGQAIFGRHGFLPVAAP